MDDNVNRELALRRRARDDFEWYAEKNLRIRTKSGKVLPFKLNEAQRYIHRRIEAQLASRGLVRVLILKGRQQGASTYTEGRFYWRVTHRRGVRVFILTHEEEATKNIFEMAQRYHELSNPLLRPSTGADNGKELTFPLLDSRYKVGTAGNKATGRSGTTQFFHGSEVAFWPHAEQHLAGVMQTVPMEPGTEIILESTANGVGGVFHQMCMDALNGIGEYELIFVPWYWQSEYRLQPPPDFERTAEEQEYADQAAAFTEKYYGEAYQINDAQLNWRRMKIAELKGRDLFNQEYPVDIETAFLFSGRPVFDVQWMLKAEKETRPPKFRARVGLDGAGLTLDKEGELRVWEASKPGARYVIGADVAEGLEQGDFSCADVLKLPGGEQVAQWHGKCSPDVFGLILVELGKLYNNAEIGPERNNHGLTTLTAIRDADYPFIYRQKTVEGGEGKYGWSTSVTSKRVMIDHLIAAVRDGDAGIRCAETIEEMKTYVEENGKVNAKAGHFDDRIIARAIAGMLVMQADSVTRPIYAQAFREALHVRSLEFLPHQQVMVGFWTVGEPAAAICQITDKGQVRVLREVLSWDSGMNIELFTKGMVRMALKKLPRAKVKAVGTSSKGRKQSAESNALAAINAAGIECVGSLSTDTGKLRNAVVKQLSQLIDGEPALVIDAECRRLIEAMQGAHRLTSTGEAERNKWLPVARALEYVVLEVDDQQKMKALDVPEIA